MPMSTSFDRPVVNVNTDEQSDLIAAAVLGRMLTYWTNLPEARKQSLSRLVLEQSGRDVVSDVISMASTLMASTLPPNGASSPSGEATPTTWGFADGDLLR